MDFTTLAYLQRGTLRQQQAYHCLQSLQLMEVLKACDPLLVGTVPIGIDLPSSDLDVIGQAKDLDHLANTVRQHYAHYPHYTEKQTEMRGQACLVIGFKTADFWIEIFAQDIPTQQQYAYRHMLVEHHLLETRGPEFRVAILSLKQQGLKTEPAFAQVLGLDGDPYEALLQLEERLG